MGNPPAKAQMLLPVEPEETRRVDIRQVRANNQRWHRQPRLTLQPGLTQQRANEGMGEIVHSQPLPRKFRTGQTAKGRQVIPAAFF